MATLTIAGIDALFKNARIRGVERELKLAKRNLLAHHATVAQALRIGEIFGLDITKESSVKEAQKKWCVFLDKKCTKVSKENPLGICCLTDGKTATLTCPTRFREKDSIFRDAATLAFGPGCTVSVVSEFRILRQSEDSPKKVGKVDFLLVKTETGKAVDFAALELQSVYVSGTEMGSHLENFLAGKDVSSVLRRPDWLSSQKRLMPQLNLKVPVFRRWGKKFFVATDQNFFAALPIFPYKANSIANSEVTWLVYPFNHSEDGFSVGEPVVKYSMWDDVKEAIRIGIAPEPGEVLDELGKRVVQKKVKATFTT